MKNQIETPQDEAQRIKDEAHREEPCKHKWTNWVMERDLDLPDGQIIQSRICTKCNYKQYDKQTY